MNNYVYFTILLSLFCFPRAYAAPGDHFIVEVLDDGNKIKLEDGFTWDVIPYDSFFGYVIHDYQAEARTWMPGDEVDLYFYLNGGNVKNVIFELINKRTTKPIEVFYGQQENCILPRIVSIETKGWRAPCLPFEEKMTLSDGSKWLLKRYYSDHTAYWQVGDPIAVYHSYADNYFVLVNPDLRNRMPPAFLRLSGYHISSTYAQPYPIVSEQ